MSRSSSRWMTVGVGAIVLAASARSSEAQVSHQERVWTTVVAAEPMAVAGVVVDEDALPMEAQAPAAVDRKKRRESRAVAMVSPSFTAAYPAYEMGGQTVTGAPYSAEAITETTQTLADGNRIVRKQTSAVARDAQGRTRREMSVTAVGSWVPEDAPEWVMINDPVAGYFYQLDERRKTAFRQPMPPQEQAMSFGTATQVGGVAYSHAETVALPATRARVKAETGARGSKDGAPAGTAEAETTSAYVGAGTFTMRTGMTWQQDAQTEPLGTQTIEGLEAVGTRTTVTIPAGAIGNEQPIRIVSEQWYSADLQTIVLSKREDPRMGETIYRLSNVSRAEPPSNLFEIPPGYKITEPDFVPAQRKPRP